MFVCLPYDEVHIKRMYDTIYMIVIYLCIVIILRGVIERSE